MGQLPISEPSPSVPADLLDAKHDALRRAGAEYFERVLEQARSGKNALTEAPRPRSSSKDIESQDEDLETVGRILPYAVGVLFFASNAARLVLAKRALQPLQTPAIQMFLHLLPAVCGMFALADVGPLTSRTLRASTVSIALFGFQTLCLFGALNYGGLFLILAWTTLTPAAIAYNRSMADHPAGTGVLNALLVAIGVSGGAIALLARRLMSPVTALCLAGWTAAEAGWKAWDALKDGLASGAPADGGDWQQRLSRIAEEEVKLPATCRVFYQSAMSAVPALLIGFVCQEGTQLVDHELSVPAVSAMLMSCAAWATAAASGVVLFGAVSERVQRRLTALTAFGALALQVALHGIGHRAEFCGALLAILGGVGAQQCR